MMRLLTGMFRWRSSQLRVLLLCILCSVIVAQSVAPTVVAPTSPAKVSPEDQGEDDEDRDRVDDNVTYIIIAVVFLFVATVLAVVVVSMYQIKKAPPPRVSRAPPVVQPDGRVVQPDVRVVQPDMRVVQPDMRVAQPDMRVVQPDMRVVQRDVRVVQQSSPPTVFTQIRPPLNPPQRTSAVIPVVNEGYEEVCTWWEIPPGKLEIYEQRILGSGQFGVIYLGEVITKSGKTEKCAVKTLKGNATEAERQSLQIELKNMSNMDRHPNIVNLIGAQTINDLYYVVVEYCAKGDLYSYVKSKRKDLSQYAHKESGTTIEYVTRLRIAFDIANGMNYLSTRGFIHRDLAARNVLLGSELRAKVSDFGRSRDISETFKIIQSIRKNEPIPTRWMPVETLRHQIFTTKSDVWSFGVLLWEVESGATRPYNDQETYRAVVNKVIHEGYRLAQPYNCPDVMYEIMRQCWKIDPEERPTFGELARNLGNLLKAHLPQPPSTLYSVNAISS